MAVTGYYSDIHDNIITVTINKAGIGDINISEEDSICFSGDGITLTENIDDVFDEMITSTCSIELLTKDYLGDLFFAKAPREITCTVTKKYGKNTTVLFDGYIAPAAFNQPFQRPYDRFTLTAVDKLSTLQYYYYKNIKNVDDYDDYIAGAGIVSFESMLNDALGAGTWDWDHSKNVSFSDLYISENEILGESFDDIWTKQDIIEQICRYLSLHIRQEGDSFYLFSWKGEKKGSSYNINKDMVMATDMEITIDDVYSQIQVKDNTTPIDTIVNSPLEEEQLYSPYSGPQKFLTEYIADGEGDTAEDCMKKMLGVKEGDISHRGEYDNVKPHRNDWFFQIKQSSQWELYDINGNNVSNLIETENNKGINQQNVLKRMRQNSFTPMLISMGANKDIADKNTSPLKKPNLTNYLVISVNGNCSNTSYDNVLYNIMQNGGMARYKGFSAANFTPVDNTTTNYLIFSGKITLAPVAYQSGTSISSSNRNDNLTFNSITPASHPMYTVPSDRNDDGRFYYHRFWAAKYPSNTSTENLNIDDNITLIYPNIDVKKILQKKPYYEGRAGEQSPFIYNYTEERKNVEAGGYDEIKKLPILACRLVIDDDGKRTYLVETYNNGTAEYDWVAEEDLETLIEGGKRDYFTIGIDPNAGDSLLGQSFEIQDNTNDYGLDATGMAIEIPYGLPLTGKVEFTILGPVNTTWTGTSIRKEGNFWRHTSWTTESKNLLSYISNIWLEDFSCSIYTDNGYTANNDNSDIYYVSNETDNSNDYIAGKHETEFKMITQLTSEECLEMDVKNTVNVNSVLDANKNAINTIKDNNDADGDKPLKAEEHYVKEYYNLTSSPKMIVTVSVKDNAELTRGKLYTILNLGKNFMLMSKTYDLKYDRVNIKLREI